MNSVDVYKLLKYYQKNIDLIYLSVKNRKLNHDIDKINNLIVELQDLNKQFNYMCRLRNENTKSNDLNKKNIDIRKCKKDISINSSKTENELRNMLLLLPNVLYDNVPSKDTVLEIYNDSYNSIFGMKFTEYITKNCIRYHLRTLFLNSELSKLKYQLINYFIEKNIDDGFKFITVPYIASKNDLETSGQLPKFESCLYKIDNNIFLIPTAEIVLCKYLEYINLEELPYLFCTHTPCFRNEDSATSKHNKPLIRQMHFDKIETFVMCKKIDEIKYLNICLERVKKILNIFNVKYKVIFIGTQEMSNTACLQYDIEVYLPHSNIWIEILSCSTCGNYQLLRSTFMKNYEEYVTINCSSFPIERFLSILIEYFYCYKTNSILINFNNL